MTVKKAVEHLENLKWLKGYDNTTVDGVPIANIVDEIIAMLKAQEPKRGRWIPHPESRFWDVCTACGIGCKRREKDGDGEIEYSYLYCPNCGAKMDDDEKPDREKVIKGLECCLAGKYPPCGECSYYGDMNYNDYWSCRLSLMADALTLLRLADAPTSDAIPIEWLVSWINRHPNDLRCMWFASLEMEWRKEQEAR